MCRHCVLYILFYISHRATVAHYCPLQDSSSWLLEVQFLNVTFLERHASACHRSLIRLLLWLKMHVRDASTPSTQTKSGWNLKLHGRQYKCRICIITSINWNQLKIYFLSFTIHTHLVDKVYCFTQLKTRWYSS